jgi:hypothetical protein
MSGANKQEIGNTIAVLRGGDAKLISDFLGNLTAKNGIDGGGMVYDNLRGALEFPIVKRHIVWPRPIP